TTEHEEARRPAIRPAHRAATSRRPFSSLKNVPPIVVGRVWRKDVFYGEFPRGPPERSALSHQGFRMGSPGAAEIDSTQRFCQIAAKNASVPCRCGHKRR